MSKFTFAFIAIITLLSVGYGVARKPFDPAKPGDEWVEVRQAKRATKAEVAKANEIENARLQLSIAKSAAKKITKQGANSKALIKQQGRQIAQLTKSIKAAKSQAAKLGRKLSDREAEIRALKTSLTSKAWKRSHWVGVGALLIAIAGLIGFLSGVATGAFFKRKTVEKTIVQQAPPAADPAIPPHYFDAKTYVPPPAPPAPVKPAPSSFSNWMDSYTPPRTNFTVVPKPPVVVVAKEPFDEKKEESAVSNPQHPTPVSPETPTPGTTPAP